MSFELGSKVYVARVVREQVWETCPDCLGTGKWHCVLPCGEEFDCECARCYHGGFQPSSGKVMERYKTSGEVNETTITGMRITHDGMEYDTGRGWCLKADNVYCCREAAQAGADILAGAEREDEHKKMHELAKKKGRPRKDKDGNPEANDMDFSGGHITYAKSQIRTSIKEALRWLAYAKRCKAELDFQKMVDAEVSKYTKEG